MLLTKRAPLSAEAADFINDYHDDTSEIEVLGSTAAVTDAAKSAAESLLWQTGSAAVLERGTCS